MASSQTTFTLKSEQKQYININQQGDNKWIKQAFVKVTAYSKTSGTHVPRSTQCLEMGCNEFLVLQNQSLKLALENLQTLHCVT